MPHTQTLTIAMFTPDIPQNLGAMMRLSACMNTGLDIIEPCGFLWNERKIRQSALDYYDSIALQRHNDWQAYVDHYQGGLQKRRTILMTTKAATPYIDFAFRPDDILMAGSESSGAPDYVHDYADGRICIPMYGTMRSLNIVNATAMILGEAIRQTQNGTTA